MEELFTDLQKCYGSVRYRRQLEMRPPEPIQLQKVKRPSGSRPVEGSVDALFTPPGGATIPQETLGAAPAAPAPTAGPAPILLTKKKERKRTLPMEIGVTADSPKPAPTAPADVLSGDEPHWLDAEEEGADPDGADDPEWSDIDIDAPAGTRG
jgi:hypothetical protein